jgi:hypothetical protein
MGLLLLLGNTGTAFSGALDNLGTGLESAWSVGRRLRKAYTGPIIRVRRSSDNTEQDFGYLVNGAVDVAAVESFCGEDDGELTTIYDQSGLSRNLIQPTSALQPNVVSSGVANTKNGKLAALFNTGPHMYVNASQSFYNCLHNGTSSTVCSVQEVLDTAAEKPLFSTNVGSAPGARVTFSGTENVTVNVNTIGSSVVTAAKTSPTFTYNAMTVLLDANNPVAADRESVWVDDSATELTPNNTVTFGPTTNNAFSEMYVGYISAPFTGSICELIIWSQDISANRAVWQSTAKTFWGTP